MLKHSGEKPYACKQCPKSFTKPGNLKQQMLIHSGEKPYVCNQCSKSFTISFNLKQHMLIHSGENPHACKQCSKSFTLSKHLKQHILSKHNVMKNRLHRIGKTQGTNRKIYWRRCKDDCCMTSDAITSGFSFGANFLQHKCGHGNVWTVWCLVQRGLAVSSVG